ncbi:MAG TPA: molybdopterin-guanine dinucleotide biosynthesis protein B [Steroidobacteraceae bacterium]|nr:molybdopterin-guanine dinucleotide biosynthesis protein B [Steroidobacteraceae bacterium]
MSRMKDNDPSASKSTPRVLGIAGWSGAGKTTLLTKLIPVFTARGIRVATLKHAHHLFDVDQPGKDSYEHRKSGACEVIVSSARRWVQMHELGDQAEATLAQLLAKVSPCDLILVEGFKNDRHPKLEVFRVQNAQAPLHPNDARVVAIAADRKFPDAKIPQVDLNDIPAVADLVLASAAPLSAVLDALASRAG